MSLAHQIKQAQKEVRTLKKTNPYIFPQYTRLMNAKDAVRKANAELAAAKAAWAVLGAGSSGDQTL
jgi:multidrug resistance efflux pump